MKGNTLRWFVHNERMESEEFVKLYMSSIEGLNMRGRPLERWKGSRKEYKSERDTGRWGSLNMQRWSIWTGRGGGSTGVAIPFG